MERRSQHRTRLPGDIVVSSELRAVNLSERGMLLESFRKLRVGRELDLELDLSGHQINATVVVRWSKASASIYSDQHQCGVEFTDLNTSDLLAIRGYLTQLTERS